MQQEQKEKTQKVVFKDEAHGKLLSGAGILASAVASTMGPSGHSVIIDNDVGGPTITKDGVTVAQAICLKDKLESIGAELMKEIASKTNELAGDGPQPLYAKVLTPRGWSTMAHLKIGDTICGTSETTQVVLGIYPKGLKQIYTVTTSDGRVVECCEEHLWNAKTCNGVTQILTTKQLFHKHDIHDNKRTKYYLPNTCVKFDKQSPLPLDPYLLGVLLGGNYLAVKRESSIRLSLEANKGFILDKIQLPEGCNISKKVYLNSSCLEINFTGVDKNIKPILEKSLFEMGLLGVDNKEKFIPNEYLFSSTTNRKKLLDGLIDINGHINKKGLFEYGTNSKQLFLDFTDLCRSIGKQVYTYKVEISPGDSYEKNSIYRICELEGHKYGIEIKKIEQTDKTVEMQCIKVSNDNHLYITDDYVATHNTTTATVLGYALLKEGTKQIIAGASSIHLKNGMEQATDSVIEFLKNNCVPIRSSNDIVSVGTISANGDREIGQLISNAIQRVGKDGIITVEPAKSVHTTLDVVEGLQFKNGYLSPFFVTNSDKSNCELNEPYVLVTSNRISSLQDIVGILETVARNEKELLIIADDVEGDALHTLIVNKMKGVIKVCAVKAPSYGEHRADVLSDLSQVVGGEVFGATSKSSIKNAKVEQLGQAKKVIITRKSCIIMGDSSNEEKKKNISDRIESIRNALENDSSLDDLRVSKYKERLASLSGGVAVIKVGGSTEVEILEKKDRVEDAVNATLAASQEGVVPGGGVALFYAAQAIRLMLQTGKFNLKNEDVASGIRTVIKVCEEPLRTIVANTGQSAEVVANELRKQYKLNPDFRVGYNAASGTYTNLVEEGVIDPVKVTRLALEHATSVVGLMLVCNAVIVDNDDE